MTGKVIKPPKLTKGDTIGIIAPCSVPSSNSVKAYEKIEEMGFKVKLSQYLRDEDYGFCASIEKRLHDLHSMAAAKDVKAVLFGGGTNSNELLPYVDFDLIRSNPKIYCSFSEGTTLLNTINAMTGMVTFCGTTPRTLALAEENPYNYTTFRKAVMETEDYIFPHNSPWNTLIPGKGEGILIGGNLFIYSFLAGGKYCPLDPKEKYILFLEDLPGDEPLAMQSRCLHHIIQSGMMEQVKGCIFGSFSFNNPGTEDYDREIDNILTRIMGNLNIPTVRCYDYGHGFNAGVIPIGVRAELDATECQLKIEGGVI